MLSWTLWKTPIGARLSVTNNYFKVGKRFFFFDDSDAVSVAEAFFRANAACRIVPLRLGESRMERPCLFSMPKVRGPWDREELGVVGVTNSWVRSSGEDASE